jgi:hypothetical protein
MCARVSIYIRDWESKTLESHKVRILKEIVVSPVCWVKKIEIFLFRGKDIFLTLNYYSSS